MHLIGIIRKDLGLCKPLYEIYNAATITICDNLIAPINGIWVSLGMSLFFLLPAMVLSKCIIIYLRNDARMLVANDEHYKRNRRAEAISLRRGKNVKRNYFV